MGTFSRGRSDEREVAPFDGSRWGRHASYNGQALLVTVHTSNVRPSAKTIDTVAA
jgi:hypothetical protein